MAPSAAMRSQTYFRTPVTNIYRNLRSYGWNPRCNVAHRGGQNLEAYPQKVNEIVLHVLYSKNTLKPLSNEGSHDVTSTEAKGEQDCHLQG
jgi:hypothetical protein